MLFREGEDPHYGEEPKWAESALRAIAKHLKYLNSKVEDLTFLSVEARLAMYLLTQSGTNVDMADIVVPKSGWQAYSGHHSRNTFSQPKKAGAIWAS
jgi:CRP-like cAMP-binding protein